MGPWELTALALVGVAAGWVNTLAGGGSMLTVPGLMLLGLSADVANATNRIAIVAQCATGVHAYRAQGQLDGRAFLGVVPFTLLGAAGGAYLATWLPNEVFRPVLLGAFALMAVTLVARPSFLSPSPQERPRASGALPTLSLLLVGFYGGFLQAGVGIVLLAVLAGMLRHDLVRANALKLAVVLAFNVVAALVFAFRDHIDWVPALALAVGNSLGARLGVRFAMARGTAAVRKVVFATVLVSCAWLLFEGG